MCVVPLFKSEEKIFEWCGLLSICLGPEKSDEKEPCFFLFFNSLHRVIVTIRFCKTTLFLLDSPPGPPGCLAPPAAEVVAVVSPAAKAAETEAGGALEEGGSQG